MAGYRLERTLMGCADPLERGSAHPISVLELAKNKVDGGVCHVHYVILFDRFWGFNLDLRVPGITISGMCEREHKAEQR